MTKTISLLNKLSRIKIERDEAWACAQAATRDDREDLTIKAQKLSNKADNLMLRITREA